VAEDPFPQPRHRTGLQFSRIRLRDKTSSLDLRLITPVEAQAYDTKVSVMCGSGKLALFLLLSLHLKRKHQRHRDAVHFPSALHASLPPPRAEVIARPRNERFNLPTTCVGFCQLVFLAVGA